MSEIEQERLEKQGEGGGAKPGARKRRKKRVLPDFRRCHERMENGRRCEAAALRTGLYCLFHDPNYLRRRKQLMFPIPYEHADQVHLLLGEAVKELREKKLKSKEAYALGYLATLLMQNQAQVEKERQRVERAPFTAAMTEAVEDWFFAKSERKKKEREEEAREEEGEEEHD